MITLGIIGVVAAMTIPNMLTNIRQKQTEAGLKKGFSQISQAYLRSLDDLGYPSVEEVADMGTEVYFNKYWAPYLKRAHTCQRSNMKMCGGGTVKYHNLNDYALRIDQQGSDMRLSFYTPDGFIYTIFNKIGGTATPSTYIFVDVNGKNAPNAMGYDVFTFERTEEGIKTLCRDQQDAYMLNECKEIGKCCTEIIRRNGWKIPKDYPW